MRKLEYKLVSSETSFSSCLGHDVKTCHRIAMSTALAANLGFKRSLRFVLAVPVVTAAWMATF
nr:hypothetical protein [Rhodoferax sp.]